MEKKIVTRYEIKDDEWKYAVFDDFMERADNGEITRERAVEMYQHVVEATERLGQTAMGQVLPTRED